MNTGVEVNFILFVSSGQSSFLLTPQIDEKWELFMKFFGTIINYPILFVNCFYVLTPYIFFSSLILLSALKLQTIGSNSHDMARIRIISTKIKHIIKGSQFTPVFFDSKYKVLQTANHRPSIHILHYFSSGLSRYKTKSSMHAILNCHLRASINSQSKT